MCMSCSMEKDLMLGLKDGSGRRENQCKRMDRQNMRNPDDELLHHAKQSTREGHDLQSHGKQEMTTCIR